jgi:hypothetical protein
VLQDLGVDTLGLATQRRKFCYACMDWSERRHHLAGALGAALLARMIELGWVKRAKDSRVVVVAEHGRNAMQQWIGGPARAASLADSAAAPRARRPRPRVWRASPLRAC